MTNIGKRKRPLEDYTLDFFQQDQTSPLWEAYKPAFQAMFVEPNKEEELGIGKRAICLYKYGEKQSNWDWYVKRRLIKQILSNDYEIEERFYNYLFGKDNNRLIYFTGHTGVGKSTLIRFLFNQYIPYHKSLSDDFLKKIVPCKIPMLFSSIDNLEKDWDTKMYDFLYSRFELLEDKNFIKNVARHIGYPRERYKLIMQKDGNLKAFKKYDTSNEFLADTEYRIKETLLRIDKKSVLEWLNESISPTRDLSLGMLFNRNVIQILAQYYNYKFVFIIDNVDQLSKESIKEICHIVYTKMGSYETYQNIKFIISTRDNFFEPIYVDTFLPSYRDRYETLHLPPLPFGEVLRKRKTFFFDPEKYKCRKSIRLKENLYFTPATVNVFLTNVFSQFDNLSKLTKLHKLSNHNIRKMLYIIECIFRSPHVDTDFLVDVLKQIQNFSIKAYQERDYKIRFFVSNDRIIDILVRGSNELIEKKLHAIMPNLYDSGAKNHYSSTLCRLFIVQIVSIDDKLKYLELKDKLIKLGHQENTIKKAVNDLLQMKVVFSNYGFSLMEGSEKLKRQEIEKRELPFGDLLLEKISPSLRYIQSMVFVTPLEKELQKLVKLPEVIYSKIDSFNERVNNALALYLQVRNDFVKQKEYAIKYNDGDNLKGLYEYYSFEEIIQNMRSHIIEDLKEIAQNSHIEFDPYKIGNLFKPIQILKI